jgi:hypothetical protein
MLTPVLSDRFALASVSATESPDRGIGDVPSPRERMGDQAPKPTRGPCDKCNQFFRRIISLYHAAVHANHLAVDPFAVGVHQE